MTRNYTNIRYTETAQTVTEKFVLSSDITAGSIVQLAQDGTISGIQRIVAEDLNTMSDLSTPGTSNVASSIDIDPTNSNRFILAYGDAQGPQEGINLVIGNIDETGNVTYGTVQKIDNYEIRYGVKVKFISRDKFLVIRAKGESAPSSGWKCRVHLCSLSASDVISVSYTEIIDTAYSDGVEELTMELDSTDMNKFITVYSKHNKVYTNHYSIVENTINLVRSHSSLTSSYESDGISVASNPHKTGQFLIYTHKYDKQHIIVTSADQVNAQVNVLPEEYTHGGAKAVIMSPTDNTVMYYAYTSYDPTDATVIRKCTISDTGQLSNNTEIARNSHSIQGGNATRVAMATTSNDVYVWYSSILRKIDSADTVTLISSVYLPTNYYSECNLTMSATGVSTITSGGALKQMQLGYEVPGVVYNKHKVVGVAQVTALAGETIEVKLSGGVDKSQTSLIPGEIYYVQETGVISTDKLSDSRLIGTALSTTNLKLDLNLDSADTTYVDAQIANIDMSTKADTTYVDAQIANIDMSTKADITYVDTQIASSIPSWGEVTTSTTVAANSKNLVDTSVGALTITLPANPTMGTEIMFVDALGQAATNNITVNGNGEKIQGNAGNLIINVNRAAFQVVYHNSATGWAFMEV